jgi:DeoR family transcriptional regulator, ulaG and ulaABCDEF operon transcriptional repressor
MHATERDQAILNLLREQNFISLQDLCTQLDASPATVRRDLERLEQRGDLQRVHGGARVVDIAAAHLKGTPFELNLRRQLQQKMAIGRAAAKLCKTGDAIIIDGGTTTFQMCPHLREHTLQVLTNSLHIIDTLLRQSNVQLAVPGGSIFREQNIILSPFDDDGLKRYHASKMFMGSAAISANGMMQADSILIQAQRKLMERADALIVLVDSSKFRGAAGHLLCNLKEVDTVITDDGITRADRSMLKQAGVEVIVAR